MINMENLELNQNPEVALIFSNYPEHIKPKIIALRNLILTTASELEEKIKIEETLKWSEPSYVTKKGSTIRIDWKKKNPDQYAIYFKCTSKLVPTFKTVFGDTFTYEGNRAIVFGLDDEIPIEELKKCIGTALQYHVLKNENLLGLKKTSSKIFIDKNLRL